MKKKLSQIIMIVFSAALMFILFGAMNMPVSAAETENLSLTASLKGEIAPGNILTISGKATGGAMVYRYQFYIKHETDENWTRITTDHEIDYGESHNIVTWSPSESGRYRILVRVTDFVGNMAEDRLTIDVPDGPLRAFFSVVTDSVVYSEVDGVPVIDNESPCTLTFSGQGYGGKGAKKVAFYFRKLDPATGNPMSGWTMISDGFRSDEKLVSHFAGIGYYGFKMDVRDETGTVASSEEKYITFVPPGPLKNTSGVTLLGHTYYENSYNNQVFVAAGRYITIHGKATGGSRPYTFAYFYKRNTAQKWNRLSDGFVSDKSMDLGLKVVGTYRYMVIVKDSTGKTEKKSGYFSVYDYNLSYLQSPTRISPGDRVILRGKAQDPERVAMYAEFAYYYKPSNRNTWRKITDGFVSDDRVKIRLGKEGTYDFRVTVRLRDGLTSDKYFQVGVRS